MSAATEWSADWDLLFTSLHEETDYEITEIEGVIPAGLRGAWFRAGPGIFENGGTTIAPVDADGLIVRITFDGAGRAIFKNRYVRTDGFVRESQAGKVLYRGVFGTLPTDQEHLRGAKLQPDEMMKQMKEPYKNVSNTSLLCLPNLGRMLSMWEGGLPYSLNPETLDTIGIETLGGILKPRAIFSAHPCWEASTKRLVNFGITTGMIPKVNIWEFDMSGESAKLLQEHRFELKDQCVIHDMCITPKWAILLHNPVSFNVDAAFTKGSSLDELISGESDPNASTRIYVVPRDPSLLGGVSGGTNSLNAEYVFESGFSYHHANAYEDEDGCVVVETVVYGQKPGLDMRNIASRIALNTTCGKGRLMRYRMPAPTAAGEVPGRGSPTLLSGSPDSCEMPVVREPFQGHKRRFVYSVDMACDTGRTRPWAALLKTDLSTGTLSEWRAPARCHIGEPCFVPSSGSAEDDGWVLVVMLSAAQRRSALVLLDARDIAAGPVCTLWLKHLIPLSTHTMWTPEPFGLSSVSKL